MARKDYYKICEVAHDASEIDITKSFRRLALQWHPDRNKNPGAEAKFKEINEAYHVLINPEKRAQYDRIIQTGTVSPEAAQAYYDAWTIYAQTIYAEFYRIINLKLEKMVERNARIMNTLHFWGGWFLNALALAGLLLQFFVTGFTVPALFIGMILPACLGTFLVVISYRRSRKFVYAKKTTRRNPNSYPKSNNHSARKAKSLSQR